MDEASLSTDLSSIELVSGAVWGPDPDASPLPSVPSARTARSALEDVVRSMLHEAPCRVSFSGGRDSSAVLAVAVHVARRDGLPLPIPVTQRYPMWGPAEESRWQELVVRHLGLEDWIRLDMGEEIDLLGRHSRRVLLRHGVLWPANAYVHLPIAETMAGGSLLTGIGGDEIFSINPLFLRTNRVLTRRVAPRPRDVLRIGALCGPRFLRRAAMRRNMVELPPWTWLSPDAERVVRRGLLEELVNEPLRWDRSIDHGWWRSRNRRLGEMSLDRVVRMAGVQACSPLADPAFLAALAVELGRTGPLGRTQAMRSLVGDLLPEPVLARSSKAEMGGAFRGNPAREFAATWDGSGVDPDTVRVDVLRRMWTDADNPPDFRTFPLLQRAWLAAQGAPPVPAA